MRGGDAQEARIVYITPFHSVEETRSDARILKIDHAAVARISVSTVLRATRVSVLRRPSVTQVLVI
jgi:hypothetical protein